MVRQLRMGLFGYHFFFFFNGVLVIIYVLMVVVWIVVNYSFSSLFFSLVFLSMKELLGLCRLCIFYLASLSEFC